MAGTGGKRAGSGRPPSLQNKITRDMKGEVLEKYPKFNPLMELVNFYYDTDDPKLKLQANIEILKKFVPDLKAIDVVSNGQTLTIPSIINLIGDPPSSED